MSSPLGERRRNPLARPPRPAGLMLPLLAMVLSACALPGAPPRVEATPPVAWVDRMVAADIVLLGELHDQPSHHRQRLQWLEAIAERRPIAIVMEQFDASSQLAIDRARGERSGASVSQRARHLAEAAGFDFKGWEWPFYAPVIEFAIARDLPLMAGNLARGDAMQIARGQAHPMAGPPPPGWDGRAEAAMTEAVDRGHCGLLPQPMLAPMVRAQRARDAQLAEIVLQARRLGRLPVLLAGNEHLRRDYGVPVHVLGRDPTLRIYTLGQFEEGGPSSDSAFDAIWRVPAIDRPDPCESLRQRFGSPGPSSTRPEPAQPGARR